MANAYRDQNSVPTLIGASNVDGFTPVRVYADPVTHRLLVDTASSTGTAVNDETPSGTIDGANKVFTLAHAPLAGTLQLFLNGQFVHPTAEYTLAGSTITFVTAPDVGFAGLPFTAVYRY
jgi:hypothetical protein